MSEYTTHQKTAVQLMRPYISGEDMTGISVSEADKQLPTLEGGWIAVNEKNPDDKWYVAKAFYDANYKPVQKATTFKERLEIEKSELDEKIEKLNTFTSSENFKTIKPEQQSFLNIQLMAMMTYSQILAERLSWLSKD